MSQPIVDRPMPDVRLTDYHRRCLDKRIGECDEALVQAVCALCEAQSWLPGDISLHAVCRLLQAAQGLTEVAHNISGASRSDPQRDTGRITP